MPKDEAFDDEGQDPRAFFRILDDSISSCFRTDKITTVQDFGLAMMPNLV